MNGDRREPSRLRVVYIHDSVSDNGAVRTTLDVAQRLLDEGLEPRVFALSPTPADLVPAFSQRVPVAHGRHPGSPETWRRSRLLARLVAEVRHADVVVCGSEIGRGLVFGAFFARLTGKPYVTVIQADPVQASEQWMPGWIRPLVMLAHRRADAVICASKELSRRVTVAGVKPARIHVVRNGTDVERLRRVRPEVTSESRPVVVSLGRLSPEKGFDLLVRAHAQARAVVDHELRVIGAGDDLERLCGLAAELEVDDSVTFTGYRREPYGLLAAGSVFVLSSRREGLPLVLLEAMAVGVPVIATRCTSAIDEILAGGSYGRIVANGSVTELAAAIIDHLRDPETLRAKAAAAGSHLERYGIDRTASGYLRVLRDVQHRRGRSRGRLFRSRSRHSAASS